MAVDPDAYRLSEAEHQAIFESDIVPELFADAKPSAQPVAIIFGGQPGAGKSASIDAAREELAACGGAVEILGDDLRDYHPHYGELMSRDDRTAAAYTDRDTGGWVEKAIAEAAARRVNVVIEGTMRNADKVAVTMRSLRDAGYRIDARVLAVSAKLSEQGILQRYELQRADRGSGRMTTPEAHRAAFDGMLPTVERIESEQLADRVTVYRRGAVAIYANELDNGQWTRPPAARAAIEAERARPMILAEHAQYAAGCDELVRLLAKPRRQAEPEETQKIATLQRQAHQDRQAHAGQLADAFRGQPEEAAMRMHPELAPAYAVMRAREAKAQIDGDGTAARASNAERVRADIAASIERGKVPQPEVCGSPQRQVDQRAIER